MVRLARIERATTGLEGRCSIQLSYRRSQHQIRPPSPPTQASRRGDGVLKWRPGDTLQNYASALTSSGPQVWNPADGTHSLNVKAAFKNLQ